MLSFVKLMKPATKTKNSSATIRTRCLSAKATTVFNGFSLRSGAQSALAARSIKTVPLVTIPYQSDRSHPDTGDQYQSDGSRARRNPPAFLERKKHHQAEAKCRRLSAIFPTDYHLAMGAAWPSRSLPDHAARRQSGFTPEFPAAPYLQPSRRAGQRPQREEERCAQ